MAPPRHKNRKRIPKRPRKQKKQPRKLICAKPLGDGTFCQTTTKGGLCPDHRDPLKNLYKRGLSAAEGELLATLALDPNIRTLSPEIARMRLLLTGRFERLKNIEVVEQRIVDSLDGTGALTDDDYRKLDQYEAIQSAHQVETREIVLVLEELRRFIETHANVTDGRKLTGDITHGDVIAFIKGVMEDVRYVCGEDKALLVFERVRARTGDGAISYAGNPLLGAVIDS